jgi:hypothetical protein
MSTLIVDTVQTDTIEDEAGNFEHARLVQVVNATYNTYDTTTSTIPLDNTIPQKTEGEEFLTATITPKNTNNTLIVQYQSPVGMNSSSGPFMVAMFQDTTANAIAVSATAENSGDYSQTNHCTYIKSGSIGTSATTFKMRYGSDGGTTAINGTSSAQLFNGCPTATLTIWEIRA